ncbi:hypothetical protein F7725_024871 [Dissostichus mawsoni]|uniref:Uncharacterized protein n=1 Tax=Dissostichus mawsoni TaxID=36200 RepID=A0A7J5XAL7_DISMA|nr:hypothetical protein F7725_024871 [Dissostichus mawsoni]
MTGLQGLNHKTLRSKDERIRASAPQFVWFKFVFVLNCGRLERKIKAGIALLPSEAAPSNYTQLTGTLYTRLQTEADVILLCCGTLTNQMVNDYDTCIVRGYCSRSPNLRPRASEQLCPSCRPRLRVSSLLADPHLLVVRPRFPLHVSVVVLKTVVFYVWQTQQLQPEGREDFLQHLQQSLLPAGGDVVLGQL